METYRKIRAHPHFSKVAILFVVIFAGIGAYLLIFSRAEVMQPAPQPAAVVTSEYQSAMLSGFPHVLNNRSLSTDDTIPCNVSDATFQAKIREKKLDLVRGLIVSGGDSSCNKEKNAQYKRLYPDRVVIVYKQHNTGLPSDYSDSWPGYFILMNRTQVATNPISAAITTITVNNAADYTSGDLAVIWEGSGAGNDFSNYEYVKVTGKSGNNLTVRRAQFGTTGRAHPVGAKVAEVTGGPGAKKGQENYLYNHSMIAPVNPAPGVNMRANAWLAKKYVAEFDTRLDGYEFDVTLWWPYDNDNSGQFDCDNNGQVDYCNQGIGNGRTSTNPQVSSYGLGITQFANFIRNGSTTGTTFAGIGPNKLLIMDHGIRDLANVNGVEFESYPTQDEYTKSSGALAEFEFYMKGGTGRREPRFTYSFTRQSTNTYPVIAGELLSCPTDKPKCNDKRNRYGIASSLITGGFHTYGAGDKPTDKTNAYPWDEDVGQAWGATGSAARVGYLGQPTGSTQRVTNYTGGNLMTNGNFESNITGWASPKLTGYSSALIRDTVGATGSGTASLRADVNTIAADPVDDGVKLTSSANLAVTSGSDYTVSFWAKSDQIREISAVLKRSGQFAQNIKIGTEWQQYFLNIKASNTASNAFVELGIGRELGQYWIDNVQVYKGSAGILTRQYASGLAILNDSESPQSVTVGSGYRKISGTQNPTINNGQPVTSGVVILDAKDGLILLK